MRAGLPGYEIDRRALDDAYRRLAGAGEWWTEFAGFVGAVSAGVIPVGREIVLAAWQGRPLLLDDWVLADVPGGDNAMRRQTGERSIPAAAGGDCRRGYWTGCLAIEGA